MTRLYDLQEGAYWCKTADDRLQELEKSYDDNNLENGTNNISKIIQMVRWKGDNEAFGIRGDYTTYEKRVRRVSNSDGNIYYILNQYLTTIKRSFPNNNIYVLKEEEIPSRDDFEILMNEVRAILGGLEYNTEYVTDDRMNMIVSDEHSHRWDYNPALKEGFFKLPDDFLDNLKVNHTTNYYGDIWGNDATTLNALGERIANMDFTTVYEESSEMFAEFEDSMTDRIFQYWKANKVESIIRSLTGKEMTERILDYGIGLTKSEIERMLTTRYYSMDNDIDYRQVIINFDTIMRYITAGGNVITHSNKRDCYTDTLGVWPKMSNSAPTNKRHNSIVFNKDLFEMMKKEWRPEWEEKAGEKRDTEKNKANYQNVTNYVPNALQDNEKFEKKIQKGKDLCDTDFDNILKAKIMSSVFNTGLLENFRGQYQPLLYNADNTEKDMGWETRHELTRKDKIINGKHNWDALTMKIRDFMVIDSYRFCSFGKNEHTPTALEVRQAEHWAISNGLEWDTDYEQINNASKLLDASIRKYNAQKDIFRIMFETNFRNFVATSGYMNAFINGGEEE